MKVRVLSAHYMNYKIVAIDDNMVTLEDTENLDEWGKPTSMQFILDDASCYKIGQNVKVMIVSSRP